LQPVKIRYKLIVLQVEGFLEGGLKFFAFADQGVIIGDALIGFFLERSKRVSTSKMASLWGSFFCSFKVSQ
jgi:hypothetical protein